MEWHLYDNDYADSIDKMSVIHHLVNDEPSPDDFGHDDFFVNDNRGYSVILDSMLEEMKKSKLFEIKLNSRVN